MEDYENDVDAETLQAQVDMSLAFTQNLVSSWLKPKYGSGASSSSRGNQEKELDELLKRPPRLGVGAPIPASTGVAGHEAMKLKGKLTGKKRAREEEDVKMAEPSDDDGESRAGAIKKKARPDPFAPKPKKQKANAPGVIPVPTKPTSKKAAKKAGSPDSPVDAGKQGATETTSSQAPASKQKSTQKGADTPTNQGSKSADEDAMEVDKMLVSPSSTSTPSSGDKPASKPDSQAVPLLNLDGPPPAVDPSPSKKRRKRNKKKKKAGQSGNTSS